MSRHRGALAALLACGLLTLVAATPAPHPSPPPLQNKLTKAQMDALAPKIPLQTVYSVATNKLGQVTAVKAVKRSKDATFNVQTFGNALQAFIRSEDGKAVSGTYTLTYDYNPKTKTVHRSVALVSAGGVDPDAEGAAIVMMEAARKEAAAAAAKAKLASPAPKAAPAESGH